jgi:hypothetical protein
MGTSPYSDPPYFYEYPEFEDPIKLSEQFEEEYPATHLSPERGGFESDSMLASSHQREIGQGQRDYVRWVQLSLNRLLGLRLRVDGIMGPQTRSAVRSFQQKYGLRPDGIVGPQTKRALMAAGAGTLPYPPTALRPASLSPLPTPSKPTLNDLGTFTRQFVRDLVKRGVKIDCADLAIELWIRFGERFGIPVTFRIWDRNLGRFNNFGRRQFPTTNRFAAFVRGNLGAVGLRYNTFPLAGGHRSAVPGDIFLYEYINEKTKNRHRFGHTRIIYDAGRGSGEAGADKVQIVQGNLPARELKFFTRPARYFYESRRVNMGANAGREPHTMRLVGGLPRRFNAFSHLA